MPTAGLARAACTCAVKAHDERRNAKGAHPAALRVPLLNARDILRNVLYRRLLVKCEPVALALDSRPIDQNSRIGSQSRKAGDDVGVKHVDLANGARVLQLGGGLAFDRKHDVVRAAHAHCGRALADCLHGVLDLEQVAVWREDGDGAVIASHLRTDGGCRRTMGPGYA